MTEQVMEIVTDAVRKRFWAKVEKGDGGSEGCWMWTAAIGPSGHGHFHLSGKHTSASRASWILHNREIPDDLFVCHTCQNTGCVRPDHLYLGTPVQNNQDGNRRKMGTGKLIDHRRGPQKRDIRQVIIENSIPVTESGCWIWERYISKSGYAKMTVDAQPQCAHRASYKAFNGPIRKGLEVRHTCDERSCVCPTHLILGTAKQNAADREVRKRHAHPQATAKLTWDDVRDIRRGGIAKDMASRYGIQRNHVYRIRRQEMWPDQSFPKPSDSRIKFSREVVDEVLAGGDARQLAERHNISREHINQIRRGVRRTKR